VEKTRSIEAELAGHENKALQKLQKPVGIFLFLSHFDAWRMPKW